MPPRSRKPPPRAPFPSVAQTCCRLAVCVRSLRVWLPAVQVYPNDAFRDFVKSNVFLLYDDQSEQCCSGERVSGVRETLRHFIAKAKLSNDCVIKYFIFVLVLCLIVRRNTPLTCGWCRQYEHLGTDSYCSSEHGMNRCPKKLVSTIIRIRNTLIFQREICYRHTGFIISQQILKNFGCRFSLKLLWTCQKYF